MSSFATVCVHAGSEPDAVTGAVVPPISLATTFAQASLGNLCGVDSPNSIGRGFEYSRTGNPTRGAFERAIAACEQGAYGLAFASGLAATNAIMSCLATHDEVICIDDVYGGTQRMFRQICAPNCGIKFTFMDFSDVSAVAAAVTSKTKLIWVESPTNPTLKISDIKALAAVARGGGQDIWLVVDNTFMSPYLQTPLDLGAHVVLHSVTKYIGGHSDVVMGALVVNDEEIFKKIRFVQNACGAVPSPFDCYLALRGLKTLHVRMDYAQKNALAIATFLEAHAKVERVVYPGLPSHPQYELAKTQAKGPGAMITFFIRGGIEEAGTFLKSLRLFTLAESLGAVESLAESPAVMTHASVPREVRATLGISDNLIRLSIGIEAIEDLLQDLAQALSV